MTYEPKTLTLSRLLRTAITGGAAGGVGALGAALLLTAYYRSDVDVSGIGILAVWGAVCGAAACYTADRTLAGAAVGAVAGALAPCLKFAGNTPAAADFFYTVAVSPIVGYAVGAVTTWKAESHDPVAQLSRVAHQADEHDHYKEADAAIAALGDLPFSRESFEYLTRFTSAAHRGSGPHSNTAIQALGKLEHPDASAELVAILKSGSLSWKRAAAALGHPRHASAIPALLEIALTHDNYICIEEAVQALRHIGTPAAMDAIVLFRSAPARDVSVLYSMDSEYSTISTAQLGQSPPPEEREAQRLSNARRDPLAFLTDAEFSAMLGRWRENEASMLEAAPSLLDCMYVERQDDRMAQVIETLTTVNQASLARRLFSGLGYRSGLGRRTFRLLKTDAAGEALFDACRNAAPDDSRLVVGLTILAERDPEKAGLEMVRRIVEAPESALAGELLWIAPKSADQVLEPYVRMLQDPVWLVRRTAVRMLLRSSNPKARAILSEHALHETDVQVGHLLRTGREVN